MDKGTGDKPFSKAINNLQTTSAGIQVMCSAVIIIFGSILLFSTMVNGFSKSAIVHDTPWLFATIVCGVVFSIILIVLIEKSLYRANAEQSVGISIAIIVLNSILILLWVAAIASDYRGYASIWPFIVCGLPIMPQIIIIALTSVSLFLRRLNK